MQTGEKQLGSEITLLPPLRVIDGWVPRVRVGATEIVLDGQATFEAAVRLAGAYAVSTMLETVPDIS